MISLFGPADGFNSFVDLTNQKWVGPGGYRKTIAGKKIQVRNPLALNLGKNAPGRRFSAGDKARRRDPRGNTCDLNLLPQLNHRYQVEESLSVVIARIVLVCLDLRPSWCPPSKGLPHLVFELIQLITRLDIAPPIFCALKIVKALLRDPFLGSSGRNGTHWNHKEADNHE